MSERRVSQEVIETEYSNPTDTRSVSQLLTEVEYFRTWDKDRIITQILAEAEYKLPINYRQVTQALIEVEYYKAWVTGRKYGPAMQIAG